MVCFIRRFWASFLLTDPLRNTHLRLLADDLAVCSGRLGKIGVSFLVVAEGRTAFIRGSFLQFFSAVLFHSNFPGILFPKDLLYRRLSGEAKPPLDREPAGFYGLGNVSSLRWCAISASPAAIAPLHCGLVRIP